LVGKTREDKLKSALLSAKDKFSDKKPAWNEKQLINVMTQLVKSEGNVLCYMKTLGSRWVIKVLIEKNLIHLRTTSEFCIRD
jgi:hypothetical protein